MNKIFFFALIFSIGLNMPVKAQCQDMSKEKDQQKALDLAVSIVKTPNITDKELTDALRVVCNNGGDSRIEDELIKNIEASDFAVFSLTMSCIKVMKLKKAVPIIFDKMMTLLANPNHELFKKELEPFHFMMGEGYKPKTYGEYQLSEYTRVLMSVGGDELHALVLPMLGNKDEKIKYRGAAMLGNLGDTIAVPYLCESLDKNKISKENFGLVQILVKLDEGKAVPYLKMALKDNYRDMSGDYPIRTAAYLALKKLGVKVVGKGNGNYKVEN